MKTIHYLPIAMALAALAPSACTSNFPAGIDNTAFGGSGGLGGDSGAGGVADAAGVATGGAVATGGSAGRGTGGVAGAEAGGAPAVGGTAIVGAGGVAGAVGLDASVGGAAGSTTGGTAGCVPAGKTSPMAMLPVSNEIGGWALSAAPASITNDADLFGRIDGAAPKYIDRGWVRSAYATYQQGGGDSSVEVAIHDMGIAENARTFFQIDLPVSRLELGPNAVVDMGEAVSYVAHGWTGQYYVEVLLDEHSDAALVYVKTFVLSILNRVCSSVPDAGSTPDAPPTSPAFRSVTAGYGEACGLRSNGSIVCWGARAPAAPPTGQFISLSLGGWPCAVRTDGTALCWDSFSGDIFGTGADGGSMVGFATPPGRYTSLSAGYARVCGIKDDGSVSCWGVQCSDEEAPPVGTFLSVSAGTSWACGVKTDHTLACWNQCSAAAIPTPPAGKFASVSVGLSAACGVKDDGTVTCWGTGPETTPPTGTFAAVSMGAQYACGVRSDGTLACWGANEYGRVIPPSGTFASISTGNEFGCGVRTDGAIACWGNNASGEATPPAN